MFGIIGFGGFLGASLIDSCCSWIPPTCVLVMCLGASGLPHSGWVSQLLPGGPALPALHLWAPRAHLSQPRAFSPRPLMSPGLCEHDGLSDSCSCARGGVGRASGSQSWWWWGQGKIFQFVTLSSWCGGVGDAPKLPRA